MILPIGSFCQDCSHLHHQNRSKSSWQASISNMRIPIFSGSLSIPAQTMRSPSGVSTRPCSLSVWYCWYFSYSLFDICFMMTSKTYTRASISSPASPLIQMDCFSICFGQKASLKLRQAYLASGFALVIAQKGYFIMTGVLAPTPISK